ncbi:uncharacterized aarF domain-containing protein kinase 2-like [Macrobrachium nipponense]|uniref:uncharacterized aarF domain-containing protein kinase 2-like n=1 Tax=Macrobrachium nipponense TaxID=159736 RepID=UPI0030C81C5F
MLQRFLLPRSWIFTKNNALLYVKPPSSELSVLKKTTQRQILEIKNIFFIKKEVPFSLKTVSQKCVKNSVKKGYSYVGYRRQVSVLHSQRVAFYNSCQYFTYKDVIRTLQRTFRCFFVKPNHLVRVALGSGLFMPAIFFRESPQAEVKTLPIEIPKETKESKNKPAHVQFFAKVYEFVRLFLRGFRLLITFVPIMTLYPVTYLGETPTELWWGLLLRAIEISGPIMIKFGQWMSTRHDLLPDSCCRQFSRLQRRIQPHSWDFTKYRMRKAFGPNWRKVFVKFDNDRKPIGSGCVAQVYKVWMSKDAIPDQDLLDEMISDLEEENDSFEGVHIQGFGSLLGFDADEDKADKEAIEDWKQRMKKQKTENESHSVKEAGKYWLFTADLGFSHWIPTLGCSLHSEVLIQCVLYAVKYGYTGPFAICKLFINSQNLIQNYSFLNLFFLFFSERESSSILELNMSAVTESVATGIVSGEGFQSLNLGTEESENNTSTNVDEEEHCLVEVWNDADHDKSLPVEETPPNDLEGLIPVAVKVLHPSMQTYFRRDLKILRACASFLTFVYPPIRWLSLPQCVDEFAHVISGQVNLKKEAENMELFSENFAEITAIKFPRPLRPYVTQKVLVETFEEGEGMSEFIGTSGEDKPNDLRIRLAEIGVDALLKMIFVDNLVHGDMHPGNMLIQNINITENGSEEKSTGDVTRVMMVDVGCDTFVMDVQPDPNPLRLCLLDCGVVAKLREKDLENFKAVFKQVVLGDGVQVADLFLENSHHSCKDPESFKNEMAELVETARHNAISLAQVDVGILLQQVLGTLLKHQVRLESAFSAVVLAVFVLEGLGRTLDPNMDILERARPILVT